MERDQHHQIGGTGEEAQSQRPLVVLAEVVPEPAFDRLGPLPPRFRRRVWLPLGLFVATCLSTWFAGGFAAAMFDYRRLGLLAGLYAGLVEGAKYAVPVMIILICHEMGHFIQAHRYGVYASWPYFIPMPISPFGTFGAVIAMEAHRGDRRSLFDIGVTGPLAGLVPTIIFLLIGLNESKVDVAINSPYIPHYGEPLLLKWIIGWYFGTVPPGYEVYLAPMAFAGWVGLFVTSLNLIPIGQLDGGHVLYALLRRNAYWVARTLLIAAVLAVGILQIWIPDLRSWILMLLLLIFVVGPRHPPTADDDISLGPVRTVLGWLILAFIPLGFTPVPISFGP